VSHVYKLLRAGEWEAALAQGVFEGSAADIADGFIHFSTAAQAAETGRRYFGGVHDLTVLQIEAGALGPALKWELSRGGDLFPHLYAPLACERVIAAWPVALDEAGAPVLHDLTP
jgi:uncharacterized protein (DUF952 family)